jgi:hypothetical protein
MTAVADFAAADHVHGTIVVAYEAAGGKSLGRSVPERYDG